MGAKLVWKHRGQIASLASHFLVQKDQILAENPDMDQSLFEIDPETATLEELNQWYQHAQSQSLAQTRWSWGGLAKMAAKTAWRHRGKIASLASHFFVQEQDKFNWGGLAKMGAKLAWKHRGQIASLASHFLAQKD
jgi:hypothetical protein